MVMKKKRREKMKTIKENWKVVLIVAAGVVAVILLCVNDLQNTHRQTHTPDKRNTNIYRTQYTQRDTQTHINENITVAQHISCCMSTY